MSFEVRRLNGVWHIGRDGAAEMCGVSTVTFMKWLDEPDPPPHNRREAMSPITELADWIGRLRMFKTGRGGGFPYLPDMARLKKLIAPSLEPSQAPHPDTLGVQKAVLNKHEEEARLTKLRADKVQLELNEAMGVLVSAEDVEKSWLTIVTRTKTRLLGIPTSVAPEIAGETDAYEIQERLMDEIRTALEDLSSVDKGDNQ